MVTIWKFPFEAADEVTISMPAGAVILSLQMQGSQPCIWATVDPDAPVQSRFFRVYGTGHPIETICGPFLGSIQLRGGPLVFHVFENTRGF